jgi:hypothetical protein
MDLPVLRVSRSVVVYAGGLPLCRLEPAPASPAGPAPDEGHDVPDVVVFMAKIADGRVQTHSSKAQLSKKAIQSYMWSVQAKLVLRTGLAGQWSPSADARLFSWLVKPARKTTSQPLALEPPPVMLAVADGRASQSDSSNSSDSSSGEDEDMEEEEHEAHEPPDFEKEEEDFENNSGGEEEKGEDEEQNAVVILQARVTDLENDLGLTSADLEVADSALADMQKENKELLMQITGLKRRISELEKSSSESESE